MLNGLCKSSKKFLTHAFKDECASQLKTLKVDVPERVGKLLGKLLGRPHKPLPKPLTETVAEYSRKHRVMRNKIPLASDEELIASYIQYMQVRDCDADTEATYHQQFARRGIIIADIFRK